MQRLLPADPRGDVAGVVHAQLQAAGEIPLRLGQLVLRDQLVAQPGELREDRPERLAETGRVHAGRDLERPRIGIVDDPGRDVVGQPALLADREEEPAAHPVAEHGIEDRQRPAVGVVAMQRRDADAELGLGGVALAERDTRAGGQRRVRARTRARRRSRVPNALAVSATRLVVGEVAGHGDDRVAGPVHRPPEVADGAGRQRADAVLVAADLAAQRPVAEHRRLEQDLAVLRGVVEVRADLLDDDPALALDLVVGEGGADDELAQDVDRAGRLAPRDAHPVHRRLAVRRGVERAADPLDRLADGARRRVRAACP